MIVNNSKIKILSVLLVLFVLLSIGTQVFAADNFTNMWNNYSTTTDTDKVLKDIFSSNKTTATQRKWIYDTIKNTCTIRMSHALNNSTTPLKSSVINDLGLTSLTGISGKYLFRVDEMTKYLKNQRGTPSTYTVGTKTFDTDVKSIKNKLKDKKGIICFQVSGWSDATGHYTLWSKGSIRYGDYFDKNHLNGATLKSVLFWEVK